MVSLSPSKDGERVGSRDEMHYPFFFHIFCGISMGRVETCMGSTTPTYLQDFVERPVMEVGGQSGSGI